MAGVKDDSLGGMEGKIVRMEDNECLGFVWSEKGWWKGIKVGSGGGY